MIRVRPGLVQEIIWQREQVTAVKVLVEEKEEKAINYDFLTGPVSPGDRVVLNTTAVHLQLGTGGYHFVMLNCKHTRLDISPRGHIMKLRYTPFQVKVWSCEEDDRWSEIFDNFLGLDGLPVVLAELHSMVAPAVAAIKEESPEARVCYVMTDGAALPLALSNVTYTLKKEKLLDCTITCGHAFGGDLEAVNVYSALIAAKEIARADAVIVAMGPGVVGTGTPYGFTGIEMGENVNRVNVLGGTAIAVPRISFADNRLRHQGVSHHTLTALGKAALTPAYVTIPELPPVKKKIVEGQLVQAGILEKHKVKFIDRKFPGKRIIEEYNIELSSMGRTVSEDSFFFQSAAVAGYWAVKVKEIKVVR